LQDYTLTMEDILHSSVKTTGVLESHLHIKHAPFTFIDVGGTRPERRKWIHTFHVASVILFFVPSNGFDQILMEDGTTNQLEEGATLFKSLMNFPFLKA